MPVNSNATKSRATELLLSPVNNKQLANLCGALDENLRQIETALDVSIARRGERFTLRGDAPHDDCFALLKLTQINIRLRDFCCEGHSCEPSIFFSRLQVGFAGFDCAADAAKEVEFPTCIESD